MVQLKFKYVQDVDAGKEIPDYESFCRNQTRNSDPYYTRCIEPEKQRKYHAWSHLDNLKKGRVAQCGYHSGDCSTATVYGIGGYRNTCPIGGINGDYPCPSRLQISGFNFADNKITKDSVIKSITISFQHRLSGLDTGSGIEYYGDSNAPNFGDNPVRVYFSNKYGRVSKIIRGGKPSNQNDRDFTSVVCKFTDVKIKEAMAPNFALNIAYDLNLNGNPGILYLKDLKVDIKYEDARKEIKGSTSPKTIYTSTNNTCAQSTTQVVEARYANKANTTPLGKKIQVVKKPSGVTVSLAKTTNFTRTFKVRDTSGVAGKKSITYNLSNDNKVKTTVSYTAKKRPLPTYTIQQTYKSNEDFSSSKNYISFKNGCVPNGVIYIYIDSVSPPSNKIIELNVASQNSSTNLLNSNAIRTFHSAVKQLSCGTHTLYINRGNESKDAIRKNKVTIRILPMDFKFAVINNDKANTQPNRCGLTDTNTLTFCQSKNPLSRYGDIIIKRIDNEPMETIPKILVGDSSRPNKQDSFLTNFKKNESKTWQIDKYYAGDYVLTLKDGSNPCKNESAGSFNFTVISSHVQNYDYLFTRGQDGTTFDFDYLVVWEGDNIREPLNIDSAVLNNSFDSLRFCGKSSFKTGLSQIGTVEITIRNKVDKLIENVNIELNTLKINEDDEKEVTTEEWINPDGIFNQFYSLFYEYNIGQEDNIEIRNLTPDNDLVDEENVYLKIKKIEALDSVKIILPYKSTKEKTVFLQLLLFEEPVQIGGDCNMLEANETDPTEIQIDVYDSMLTNLSIEGNTDLLSLDPRYDCPTECYTTVDTDENGIPIEDINSGGITYKITNIDTNDFLAETSLTKIINSKELIPYAYIVDGQQYNLLDENDNIITVQEERYLIDENGDIITDENDDPIRLPNKLEYINRIKEIPRPLINTNIKAIVEFPESESVIYTVRTDKNGFANFYIPIPVSLNRSYTTQELMSDIITFEFEGNEQYNKSSVGAKGTGNVQDDTKNNTFLQRIDNFRRYKPGEVANILVNLKGNIKIIENYFNFYAELKESGHSDQVTILYKICNLKNNEGIFKTTFKTDDIKLIDNEVSKNIYAGIDTNIDLRTNIDKKIVENHNINVINISVENKEKENYDVEVQINLGKPPEQLKYLGRYDFLDISIDNGDYSIIEEGEDVYVSWLIGKMNPFETEKGIIKIKAKEIGLSDIKVNCYDYLHPKNSDPISIKNSKCVQCEEKTKWRLQNSKWHEFDGIMYKLFDDGIYRRKINNEWVEKDD